MATQHRNDPGEPGYNDDLADWAYHQSRLLLALRPAGLDWANIAEELKDLGNSQFKAFTSALEILIWHMLKWDMQAERRGTSWANSIAVQRNHAEYELRANPSFKSRIDEALDPAWFRAVRGASGDMNVPIRDMPKVCPYSWDEIINRPFDWPEQQ